MTLNPKITKDASGVLWVNWTPDPTAEGYAITTPTGSSRTFNPTANKSKLGRPPEPVTVTVAALDVTSRPAETTTYPTPDPTPSPGTTLHDLRATAVTAIPFNGRTSPAPAPYTSPTGPDKMKALLQNGDIALVGSPHYGRGYDVLIHQDATWAASSHNPWGDPSKDTWHQVPNSAELTLTRIHVEGEVLWYAQSILIEPDFTAPTRSQGWAIFTQLCYPGIISPPVGLECNAAGIGVDRDAGVAPAGTTDMPVKVRAQIPRLTVAAITGKRVDLIVGARWTVGSDGWVKVLTRLEGEPGFTEDYLAAGPTYQQVAGQPLVTTVDEKQGGYVGLFGQPQPVGALTAWLLRGLTIHPDRASAEGSLA